MSDNDGDKDEHEHGDDEMKFLCKDRNNDKDEDNLCFRLHITVTFCPRRVSTQRSEPEEAF